VTWFAFEAALPSMMGLGFAARLVAGVSCLAPLSLSLGMPFPLGLRLVGERAPGLIPWAWGTNACLTVIGSVVCVIVSIASGFTTALLMAGCCYALASLAALRMRISLGNS
jgi:hypothetical protein